MTIFAFIVVTTFLLSPISSFAINFADYIIGPDGHSHTLSTGELIQYKNQGDSKGNLTPIRMYKNNNYEQFLLGPDGSIYRREDTSWATPDWGTVFCSGQEASYTLAPCDQDYSPGTIVTNDGIKWLPPSGNPGQNFPSESFKVVPIIESLISQGTRQSCQASNVSGYPSPCTGQNVNFVALHPPNTFTFCSGLTNEQELIELKVTSGPGAGDTFYYMKGWGMVGFEAPGFIAGLMGPGADSSTCVSSLSPCNLETMSVPVVHINEANPSQPDQAQDPINKHPDNYPPEQEFVTVCEDNQTDVSQTFEPDPSQPTPVPRTITELNNAIETSEFTSNFTQKITQYLKPITNPFANQQQINSSFRSYGNNYISAAYRMTPVDQQNQIKNQRLADVQRGTIINEQIAWGCTFGCFTLNCGKPADSCRPVFLDELAAYQFQNEPISDPLSPLCYQSLYQYLPTTNSGSLNSKVLIHNVNNTGQIVKSEPKDRMLPYSAALTNKTVFSQLIAARQTRVSSQICKTIPKPAVDSTTNLVKFNLFHAILEIITNLITIRRSVTIEEQHDPRLKPALEEQETFISNFLPAKENLRYQNEAGSGASQNINIISPGYRLELKLDLFTKYLDPAQGHSNPL